MEKKSESVIFPQLAGEKSTHLQTKARARTGDAPTPKKRERERERERETRTHARTRTRTHGANTRFFSILSLFYSNKKQHVVSFIQTRRGRRFRQSLRRDPVPARETTREIANPRRRRLLVQDGKDRLRGRRTVGETPEMEKIRTKEEKVQDAPRGEL